MTLPQWWIDFVTWVVPSIHEWVNSFNTFAWVTSNLLIAYIAVILFLFVGFYFIFFDPRATTAGKWIFRFILFLVGVIGLVFVGMFIDPTHGREWSEYPGDVIFWRPLARLVVYGYGAITITGLLVVLVVRKWWPEKLRTANDRELVKVREHIHN